MPAILSVPTILMCRIAYLPDGRAYILGGTSDFDYTVVSKKVFLVDAKEGNFYNAQPMTTPRCNFGIWVNPLNKTIIVAGGDLSLSETTNHAEMYDWEEDMWIDLGFMREKKSAMGLWIIGQKYLYSFGGICKERFDQPLSDRIERINLFDEEKKWELISLLLPNPISDIGWVQASPEEILLFGGWNKEPIDKIFLIRIYNLGHYIVHYENKMEKPDWFPLGGVFSLEQKGMRVWGRKYVHIFNWDKMSFTSREILERAVQLN